MDSWVIWIVLAALFGLGEMHTGGFFLAPFAGGALIAGLAGLIFLGFVPTIAIFIVVSLLLLWVVRPIARAHLHTPPEIRTGTAALVGKTGTVLERVSNHEALGCVRIDGEVWTARAFDDDEEVAVGARVRIVDIKGATALVTNEGEY